MILCAVLLCPQMAAQTLYAGILNSPKSIGIEADFPDSDNSFKSLSLTMDFCGFYSGKHSRPGIKAGYSFNRFISIKEKEHLDIIFYMGPGVSAGYVYDNGKSDRAGAVLSLTGTAGWFFRFNRKICLNLSWTLEAGMHVRKDESSGNMKLAFYKNGVYRFPYPQLSIIRQF